MVRGDQQGDKLAAILSAWVAMSRDAGTGEIRELLDERVTWQGLRPGLACHGRDEVLALFDRQRGAGLHLVRLEAEEVGDRVLVSFESPVLPGIDGVIAEGEPRSLVFTFGDGRVVQIASYASRDEAYEALR